MKKIICIFLILMCFGCTSKVINVKKANGDSKTYLFFKNFNVKSYYVSFYDRNSSKNDDTKIIIARDNDRYYYEINGAYRQGIVQKDGVKYTIDYNNMSYFKESSELYDYSTGILPSDIDKLKVQGYKKGEERVFNSAFYFEKYKNGKEYTTYYYKNDKLIYIKYKNIQRQILFKFDSMKDKYDKKIFDIDSNLILITY